MTEIYVATLAELPPLLGVAYGTIERLSKGRTSAGKLTKTDQGWPVLEAARLLLGKKSRNDPTAKGDLAERVAKSKAKREEARAILEHYRAAKMSGSLVFATDAKEVRLKIIAGFVGILDAMPEEAAAKSGLAGEARETFSSAMQDWQLRQRAAMGSELE